MGYWVHLRMGPTSEPDYAHPCQEFVDQMCILVSQLTNSVGQMATCRWSSVSSLYSDVSCNVRDEPFRYIILFEEEFEILGDVNVWVAAQPPVLFDCRLATRE